MNGQLALALDPVARFMRDNGECAPVKTAGPRDGETFEATKDEKRLNHQAEIVWNLMRDGEWRTLQEISARTKAPEASVSARLRDLRKEDFGGHTVARRRCAAGGTYEYRLLVRVAP